MLVPGSFEKMPVGTISRLRYLSSSWDRAHDQGEVSGALLECWSPCLEKTDTEAVKMGRGPKGMNQPSREPVRS